MSFREKMDWVMLVALVVAAALYFVPMARVIAEAGFVPVASMGIGIGAVIPLIVIAIVGAIVSALTNVRDANTPEDERERAVTRRGEAAGSYILAVGVIGVIVLGHLQPASPWIMPALVAALFVGEIASRIWQIVLYRMQA